MHNRGALNNDTWPSRWVVETCSALTRTETPLLQQRNRPCFWNPNCQHETHFQIIKHRDRQCGKNRNELWEAETWENELEKSARWIAGEFCREAIDGVLPPLPMWVEDWQKNEKGEDWWWVATLSSAAYPHAPFVWSFGSHGGSFSFMVQIEIPL